MTGAHQRGVRLVHISDVHIGDAASHLLDAATAAIKGLAPDVVVLSGDLTQSGRRREYAEAAAFLSGLNAVVVATPGNHDAPVFNPVRRMIAPYARFRRLPVRDTWRGAGPEVAIETVPTARAIQARWDWSQGAFDLRHVRAALDRASAAQWRVIVAHHPPGTLTGAPVRSDARRARDALALFSGAARTLFLCGHSHGFQLLSLTASGAAVLVAPSLASGRPRTGAHGFTVLDITADAAAVTLWLFEGSAYAPAMQGRISGLP